MQKVKIMYEIATLITVGVLSLVFYEELKSPFTEYFKNKNKGKSDFLAAERLARVKALSDRSDDIEKFISSNVNILSEESMNILLARLELLKADSVIDGDSLKNKIDALPTPEPTAMRRPGAKK